MTSGSNLNQLLKAILDELNALDNLALEIPQIEAATTQLRALKFDICARLRPSTKESNFSIVIKHIFARQKDCNQILGEFKTTIAARIKESTSKTVSTKNHWNQKLQDLVDFVIAPHDEVQRLADESDAEDRDKIKELNQMIDKLNRKDREITNFLNLLKSIEEEQRARIESNEKKRKTF